MGLSESYSLPKEKPMNPSLNTRSVVKASGLVTILIVAMLLPVIVIAWISKWIYNSRK